MTRKIVTIGRLDVKSPSSEEKKGVAISQEAIRLEYQYGLLGLIIGFLSIIAGCILTINGAFGSVSWSASFLGLKSQVSDAIPGVVLFIIGLFLALITRPKIKIKKMVE